MSGPGGDVCVVYLEADVLAAAFAILPASAEPSDRWFRDHVRRVHSIAVAHVPSALRALACPETPQFTRVSGPALADHGQLRPVRAAALWCCTDRRKMLGSGPKTVARMAS